MGKGFAGVLRIGQTCAKATKNHAWTPFQFGCLSSPTRKARGSNPPGRTKSSILLGAAFLFCMKLCGMLRGGIRTARARRLRPGGQKQSCGLFLGRGSPNPPGRTKKGRCIAVQCTCKMKVDTHKSAPAAAAGLLLYCWFYIVTCHKSNAVECKNRHPSPICTQFEHHLAGVLAPLSRTEAPKPYNWFSTAKL